MRLDIHQWLPWRSSRYAGLFPALKSANYRRYFFGQGFSLIGTWMQRLATSWLVYRLTGSALLLGAVDFASQFSAFLIMPLAGVVLDRVDLRKFLLVTQIMGALQAAGLAALTLADRVTFANLVGMSILQGFINAFDMPGRQSFAVHLVDHKEDLGNAIALNSSMFNSARLLGPSVAGLVVMALGEGMCFLVNAISFFPIILVLATIRISPKNESKKERLPLHRALREGLVYSWAHPVIRSLLILLALASFVGMSYVVLLPIFAKEILHGGPQTLGFLTGATGVGALSGALYLATCRDSRKLYRVIVFGFGGMGLCLTGFAWSDRLLLSLVLMVGAGFGMVSAWAACNTLLQETVDDDKRARVMSLYMMSFMGMAPLGSLLMGYLSQNIGPRTAVTVGGICSVLGAALFAHFRPVSGNELEKPIGRGFGPESDREIGRS
jgi:MFS family permease